ARVQLGLLSGEHEILSIHIVHENAQSLHPDIDMGQVVGAFIQSVGWCTMEELVIDTKGRYLSANPSTYKIPGVRDLPRDLRVTLQPSKSAQASILGSKAVGEPPFMYGMAVFFALQNAIQSVKPEAELSFPATPEAIIRALN
ncbi:MAG: molybdopterin-dependent oxidoreductase, partial [Candidatus Cloacimonetes bacterium]|nr:molybdopterin-dependent oxidoreductase [Candidatus Cloacimonadota bacterium]